MFEYKWVSNVDLFPDAVIHGIDVGLVDAHTFLGKRRSIVDWDVMELWVVTPVLI